MNKHIVRLQSCNKIVLKKTVVMSWQTQYLHRIRQKALYLF